MDDKQIVSGSWDNTLRIWDCETGNPVGKPFEGHVDSVRSVAFSPDGARVASGSYDKTIRLWDLSTGKQSGKPIQGHEDYVNSVVIFLGDQGKHILASGSSDKTIRILDAKTGTWDKTTRPFRGHTEPICSVAFSPDGKQIVSGSQDKTVRIWDFETGAQVGEALGRDLLSDVFSVAFSPDGQRVVSGSQDGEVRVWELTGKQVGKPLRIKGHTGPVHLVAFSNDGEYIVSGSGDKTVCIWDSKTGKQVGKPLQGHTDAVQSVAFSSDGKRIVSGSRDNTIRIWDAELLYLNSSLDDPDEDADHTDTQVPQPVVDARYSPTFAELTKITLVLLLACVLTPSEKRVCPNMLKSGENDSYADMLSDPHVQNSPIKTLTGGLRRQARACVRRNAQHRRQPARICKASHRDTTQCSFFAMYCIYDVVL